MMMRNNNRFDLSDYLIHFFRKLEQDRSDCPPIPEYWGFHAYVSEEDPLSPFFLLRNAVHWGRLWATWSVRSGRRTIYGPSPAVCFTEMPVAAFIEAGEARAKRGEAMSPYGLVIPKIPAYQIGTRPVIYGLSGETSVATLEMGERYIDQDQLPLLEQYRYVTYEPGKIDWTHEREWRWPLRNTSGLYPEDGPPSAEDLKGLDIDDPRLTGIGAIVKSKAQADRLAYTILARVDRGGLPSTHYDFILPMEFIPDPIKLRDRVTLAEQIGAARIDLSVYYTIDDKRAEDLEKDFSQIVKQIEDSAPKPASGEVGGCWLWFHDNTHELVRALLWSDRITVNRDGKYLGQLYEYNGWRSFGQREEMTARLAKIIKDRFGIDSVYFSVLGSDDPDRVPFYCDSHEASGKLYNHSNDPDDY